MTGIATLWVLPASMRGCSRQSSGEVDGKILEGLQELLGKLYKKTDICGIDSNKLSNDKQIEMIGGFVGR